MKATRIIFCLFLAFLVVGVAGCIPLSALSYTEPTPVLVSHIAEELNGLTKIWSRDDVYVLDGWKTMDASSGMVCLVGDLGKPSRYDQIVCVSSDTGEVAWKGVKAVHGLLAATPKGLFVADLGSSLSVFPGLNEYDLQSGELLWRKRFIDSNPTGLQFFDNQVQLITWKPGQKLWVFDTDGNVLKTINNTYTFLTTPEVTFTSETGVRAVRTDTSEVLWDHTDTGLSLTPIVTQDKIFCRKESITSGTAYYALDRNTGKLLWQVHDIVGSSGLAYSPEKRRVYVLQQDGGLLAVDEDSGAMSIVARFTSPLFLSNIDGTAETYELAYDREQHILVISFGDSHQLIAFREQ